MKVEGPNSLSRDILLLYTESFSLCLFVVGLAPLYNNERGDLIENSEFCCRCLDFHMKSEFYCSVDNISKFIKIWWCENMWYNLVRDLNNIKFILLRQFAQPISNKKHIHMLVITSVYTTFIVDCIYIIKNVGIYTHTVARYQCVRSSKWLHKEWLKVTIT